MRVMTSRERQETVIGGGVPDRVPATVHQWQPYHYRTIMQVADELDAFLAVGLDAVIYPWACSKSWTSAEWVVESTYRPRGDGTTDIATRITTPGGVLTSTARGSDYTTSTTEHLVKRDEDIDLLARYPYDKENSMQVTVRSSGTAEIIAPATLLGHNLEMCGDTDLGMMSDRLANAKFRGPADAQTGIAPGWQPATHNNYADARFALTPGMSLSGNESQLIHVFVPHGVKGILQTQRKVRAGETLEVEVWARAQHRPVTLQVGLRPLLAHWDVQYCSATLQVEATYWKRYTAILTLGQDDDEAVFFCLLHGEGMVWIDQMHLRPYGTYLREDLLAKFATLQIPVLRFPGGCITTNYHWKYGVGPAHLRPSLPDPVFKYSTDYGFGTDEYLALCQEQGIIPHITVNIGTGTPEEAGEWAAYCAAWFRKRGIEPPLMYWQMGNEHNGTWELGNMTGEQYAKALREFVPPVRQHYPDARIIAIAQETGEVFFPQERLPWRQPVLEQAADLVDVISMHYYACVKPDAGHESLVASMKEAMALADRMQKGIDDCRTFAPHIKLAVTEFNLWQHGTHYDDKGFLEKYDVLHALFVSAVLHNLTRLAPDMELVNFYHLLNPMGIYRAYGPEIEETLMADLFRLYRPAYPGRLLPVEAKSPALTEGITVIDTLGLQTTEATWLFITNRHWDEEATIDLSAVPKVSEILTLTGERPQSPSFRMETMEGGRTTFTVPPLTMARVKCG